MLNTSSQIAWILGSCVESERRAKVLKNMLEQEYITQAEYDTAMEDDVYSRIQTTNEEVEESSINTYFVDALTDDVLEDLVAAGYNETQAYTLTDLLK